MEGDGYFFVSVKQCIVDNDRGDSSTATDKIVTDWMPLLLIVPLRLGLSEINPVYIDGLKVGEIIIIIINLWYIKQKYSHIAHMQSSPKVQSDLVAQEFKITKYLWMIDVHLA